MPRRKKKAIEAEGLGSEVPASAEAPAEIQQVGEVPKPVRKRSRKSARKATEPESVETRGSTSVEVGSTDLLIPPDVEATPSDAAVHRSQAGAEADPESTPSDAPLLAESKPASSRAADPAEERAVPAMTVGTASAQARGVFPREDRQAGTAEGAAAPGGPKPMAGCAETALPESPESKQESRAEATKPEETEETEETEEGGEFAGVGQAGPAEAEPRVLEDPLWARVSEAAGRLGIQQLYPEQERAIAAALQGRDVLVVLPTGFGKSVCYQIPSMILPQPVVLVSPLLALLKDQQEKLLTRNIPVERIDGTVRGKVRQEALERIARGGPLLVMTTPETLGSEELGVALHQSGISLAAVDEAHCISEWGHDFRPAYMRVGERLRQLGSPPVLALTATATQAVRDDIIRYLGMRDPAIVAASPHRANLAFEVVHATGNERVRALTRFIKRLRRPGIVYCSTTKTVDQLYGALRLMRLPVHRYHGKMPGKDRNREQELFMKRGRRTIMVATSAFGLGIDKPDIRYIVHFQAPASLEQYVQEAGRAGRDGRRAHCILLFDPKDRETHEVLQQGSRIRPDQLYRISSVLAAYAAEGREPDMEALTLAAQLNERQAKALLVVLEEAELLKLDEERIQIVVPPDEFEEQARALATRFVTLRTQDARRLDRIAEYAGSRECRAVFLRRYFGEEDGTPCGLCDNCRGAVERPATFYQPIARPERPKRKRRKRKKRRGQGKAQVFVVRQAGAPLAPNGEPVVSGGETPPPEPLLDLAPEPEPQPLPLPADEN